MFRTVFVGLQILQSVGDDIHAIRRRFSAISRTNGQELNGDLD
jgi:hypothetical protein